MFAATNLFVNHYQQRKLNKGIFSSTNNYIYFMHVCTFSNSDRGKLNDMKIKLEK